MPCRAVRCRAVQCRAVPCSTVPYHAVPCCAGCTGPGPPRSRPPPSAPGPAPPPKLLSGIRRCGAAADLHFLWRAGGVGRGRAAPCGAAAERRGGRGRRARRPRAELRPPFQTQRGARGARPGARAAGCRSPAAGTRGRRAARGGRPFCSAGSRSSGLGAWRFPSTVPPGGPERPRVGPRERGGADLGAFVAAARSPLPAPGCDPALLPGAPFVPRPAGPMGPEERPLWSGRAGSSLPSWPVCF